MKHKRLLAGAMCAAMLTTSFSTAAADAANTNIKTKDEVIYANLSARGKVEAIYAVNRFEVTGSGRITDYGNYSSLVNLTNTDSLNHSGDTVSFGAEEGNFYYQGNMKSTDLPWRFDIWYKLDGEAVTEPTLLGGASGKLEIGISTRMNGEDYSTFYDNYMLQISASLDTDKCKNIDAPDATLANAGKDKVINFTVMPGKDADYSIRADVTDFEMAGISINAVPYSMNIEFPDMDDKFEDLEKLPEAIADLNDGVGQVESGSNDMRKGANQLVEGSQGIKNGLSMLNGNSGQLKKGSAEIQKALSAIASSLKSSGLESMDFSQVGQLPDGLNQLSAGLSQLSGGLGELKGGYGQAYAALDGSISGIPAASVSQEQIQGLYATVDPSQHEILNALVANYTAAQTVKGTYAQVKPGFEAVAPGVDSVSGGLDEMAATLGSQADEISASLSQLDKLAQLSELSSGLNQLSNSYGSFNSGLSSYMDGVNRLSSNYGSFHNGLVSFRNGVGELNSGLGELHDGTSTLQEEVADMPDMMQEEIDKLKEEFLPSDFETESFTSHKNEDVEYVQFIIQCGGVELPKPAEPPVEEEQEKTFMDRVRDLF